MDRPCRAVKGGEEAVAGRVHLLAAEAPQLRADGLVMLLKQLAPGAVPQLGRSRGGADDVREENRREDAVRLGLPRLPFDNLFLEAFELGKEPVGVADLRGEVTPGQFHQAGAGNVLRQVSPVPDVHELVVRSLHDQGRDPNQGQYVADVHVEVHPQVGSRRARADAESDDSRKALPFLLRRARRATSKPLGGSFAIAPTPHGFLNPSLPLGSRRKPGKLRAPDEARPRVDQDEGSRSLGIRGCEQRAEWTPVSEPTKDCTLHTCGVHDRADVVHARLERRRPDNAVGHAGSSLVEQEQAAERSEPTEEPSLRRVLPGELDVMGHAGDKDEVERPRPRPGRRC